MNTVFLGTSEFAAAILLRLADSRHRPTLVVSRPDRPQGRGRTLKPPPVVEAARDLGIEIEQPESVNGEEARGRIAQATPGRVIVCAFGALIREPLLSEHGPILNVHPSLLPRWRGAAPIERAILAGDEFTGVSIMELTEGLDSGPVCARERIEIEADDDFGTLSAKLEELGADLLLDVLDRQEREGVVTPPVEQDESLVTYAEKVTAEDRLLDPAVAAAELARRVRALSPHVGAYVELADGTRLGVLKAAVRDGADPGLGGDARDDRQSQEGLRAGSPGDVMTGGRVPALITSTGILDLLVVQPPGKRPMPGGDYLRGLRR